MHGEAHRMVDRGEDEQSASRMTAERPEGEGWKLENVSARRAENGGVIVTCSKRREPTGEKSSYENTYQSKDYAFGTVEDALGYIAQELGAATGSGGGMGKRPVPAMSMRG